jgi:hypothetical protein
VFGIGMRELQSLCPAALEEPFGPVADLYRPLTRRLDAVPGILRADCLALFLGSGADGQRR